LAYVVVSLPISAIATAGNSVTLNVGGEPISIREVIQDNSVTVKNFSISFFSLAFKLSLEVATSFRTARRMRAGHPSRPSVWVRHPHIARSVFGVSQAVLALLLVSVAVNALIVPFLFEDAVGAPTRIGEVLGAEIVMALAIWALAALLIDVRRRSRIVVAPRPLDDIAASAV
jgi:hypothetical protein